MFESTFGRTDYNFKYKTYALVVVVGQSFHALLCMNTLDLK